MYIPAGGDGNVTVVHEDSPDKYTVVDDRVFVGRILMDHGDVAVAAGRDVHQLLD